MMKKILLFAMLGLFVASCSDDDPTVLEQEIVGTWKAQEIGNFQRPADMPEYIRIDGVFYYSADSEAGLSSTGKSYTISYNYELKAPVLNISGDSREYVIVLGGNDLDLCYLVTAADPDNDVSEKWQSQPYIRIQAQTAGSE